MACSLALTFIDQIHFYCRYRGDLDLSTEVFQPPNVCPRFQPELSYIRKSTKSRTIWHKEYLNTQGSNLAVIIQVWFLNIVYWWLENKLEWCWIRCKVTSYCNILLNCKLHKQPPITLIFISDFLSAEHGVLWSFILCGISDLIPKISK